MTPETINEIKLEFFRLFILMGAPQTIQIHNVHIFYYPGLGQKKGNANKMIMLYHF